MKYKFYKNPGLFCAQTCMKIILKFYFPTKKFTLPHLAKLSYKKRKKLTNSLGIISALDKLDLEAKLYSQNDNCSSGLTNKEYKKILKKLKNKKLIKLRQLKIKNLKNFINKNYSVIVLLNWKVIKNKKGYCGHYVILNNITSKKVSVINVGPNEAKQNYGLPYKKFDKAWHSKGTDSDTLIIYGKK